MFGKIILLAALALIAWAMVARASQGAGPTVRYTVKPGDTLWSIAVNHYAGDPRDGIWKVEHRNHLSGAVIQPGERLVLP
jgi:LysM repeat protein